MNATGGFGVSEHNQTSFICFLNKQFKSKNKLFVSTKDAENSLINKHFSTLHMMFVMQAFQHQRVASANIFFLLFLR
jgi:hypothetical protein